MKQIKHSMYIRWSDEDQVYICWLPELGPYCMTHGRTYEEAAKNGRESLEAWIEAAEAGEINLPEPHLYGGGQSITPPKHEVRHVQQLAGV